MPNNDTWQRNMVATFQLVVTDGRAIWLIDATGICVRSTQRGLSLSRVRPLFMPVSSW